jgi:threonine dehydrogenase-like Zn-dependent dehydrogenase
MRAAYMLNRKITVGEVPDPTPKKGQVLVRTHSCGLCASDLHVLHHADRLIEWSKEVGGPFNMDLSRPLVLGHEYVGEIVDHGPGTSRRLKPGTRVTSLPVMFRPDGIDIVGLTNDAPGGLGEYMLLDESLLMEIPSALDSDMAALTEPLAVGLHHARIGRVGGDDVPLVVGCGAIGLGIIAGLKLLGVSPIIAADFSSQRRDMALQMGADIVINPKEMTPYAPISAFGSRRATVIFECVGVPGVLDGIMRGVGHGARIIVGGWCLETDHVFTPCAHLKQLNIQFAGGEDQEDMDLALRAIGDGRVNIKPWLGARTGLNGVADGLEAIGRPSNVIRTVVDPRHL